MSGPSSRRPPRPSEKRPATSVRTIFSGRAGRRAARDAVLSEEGADDRFGCARAGLDCRPPRRHPGVRRARARRLGRACRALASRRADRRRGGPAGQGMVFATRRSPHRRPAPEAPRIVVSRTAAAGFRAAVRDALSGTLVAMGSAGAKAGRGAGPRRRLRARRRQ